MSTYVINNRIPKFPLREHYPNRAELQKSLEAVFQIWLKERFISNLVRRKACSQLYDFSVWMKFHSRVLEASQAEEFSLWGVEVGQPPLSDWGDFLSYARSRLKSIDWEGRPLLPTPLKSGD
jgi:hypothetical protein